MAAKQRCRILVAGSALSATDISVEGRAMLRSANYGELVEPQTRGKHYGPRSFRVAAPFVWNYLPRHLRNDDISREQFARDLKTVLFARAYSSEAPLRTSA